MIYHDKDGNVYDTEWDPTVGWDEHGPFKIKIEVYGGEGLIQNATCFRVISVTDFFSHSSESLVCRHNWNGGLGRSSVVVHEEPDMLVSDAEIAAAEAERAARAQARARKDAEQEAAWAAKLAQEKEQRRLSKEAALAELNETPEVKAARDAEEMWMAARCHHNGIWKLGCRICRDSWGLARPSNPHGSRPPEAKSSWEDHVVCDCGRGCERSYVCARMLQKDREVDREAQP